jgi:hypothetical protein
MDDLAEILKEALELPAPARRPWNIVIDGRTRRDTTDPFVLRFVKPGDQPHRQSVAPSPFRTPLGLVLGATVEDDPVGLLGANAVHRDVRVLE